MTKWIIQDREAGNFIEEYDTHEEALNTLNEWEKIDKENGEYTPDFYEIVEIEE